MMEELMLNEFLANSAPAPPMRPRARGLAAAADNAPLPLPVRGGL
jgi:hypothetical protein